VIFSGWTSGESIHCDPNVGTVEFSVYGPARWLDEIASDAICFKEYPTLEVDSWVKYSILTVDKVLYDLLVWRSTVFKCCDATLTNDSRRASIIEAAAGSLWQQLKTVSQNTILAMPSSDRYGRLYVQIDQQYIPVADRSTIPVVMEITKPDIAGDIDIDRQVIPPVALLELSGTYWDGVEATEIISRSAGTGYGIFGKTEVKDRLLLSDQAQANELAGLMFSCLNNEFSLVSIPLAANNRMIDITPASIITLSLAAGDTPRGIAWSNKRFIPRRVDYKYRPESGVFLSSIELEAETTGALAVTVDPDQDPEENYTDQPDTDIDWPIVPTYPPLVGYPPPTYIPEDPITGVGGTDCRTNTDAPITGPFSMFMTGIGILNSWDSPNYIYSHHEYWVRSSAYTNKTLIEITGWFEKSADGLTWAGDTDNRLTVECMDGDGTYSTATLEAISDTGRGTRRFIFEPAAGHDINQTVIRITPTLRPTWYSYNGWTWLQAINNWPVSSQGPVTPPPTMTNNDPNGFDFTLNGSDGFIDFDMASALPAGSKLNFRGYFASNPTTWQVWATNSYNSAPDPATWAANGWTQVGGSVAYGWATLTNINIAGYRYIRIRAYNNFTVLNTLGFSYAWITGGVEAYRLRFESVRLYNVCPHMKYLG